MTELHLEILRPAQRRLWDTLQRNAAVLHEHGFILAGGTALALQVGHRESDDFDFFSRIPGVDPVREWIEQFPGLLLRDVDAHTLHAEIDGVKVSMIANYRYPFLLQPASGGRLAMADILDIALMKMLAITHRATVRDYIDLAVILRDHCSLHSLIDKSKEKYGDTFNVMLALRTMVHFDDLDGEMPVVLDPTLASSWKDVLRTAVERIA